VRRAIGDDWPALSRIYGIHPWHVGGAPSLSFYEISAYQADLDEVRWRNRPR
jgi:hypothetical protein